MRSPYTRSVTTWRDALTGIPRVDQAAWRQIGSLTRWLIASRAAVLVMTVLSAVVAGLLAWRDGMFDPIDFLVMTAGLVAAHAANNILNDLTDHLTGTDHDNSFRTRYGTQPLEAGLMTIRQNLAYFVVTGGVALTAGVYLTVRHGPLIIALAGAGALFLLAYSWPLKHIGLGEISALIVWGPLMIGGGYFAITGQWSWPVVVAGLPYALGVTAVLFAKHIDKYDNDTVRGIHTLPVVIGPTAARSVVLAMVAAQYVIVGFLVAAAPTDFPILLVLGAAPLLRYLVPVFTQPAPESPPEGYPSSAWPLWYVSFAFVHNRRFGALYVLGLVGAALLH